MQELRRKQKWLTSYWDTVAVFHHKNFHKNDFKFHKAVYSGEVENVCSTNKFIQDTMYQLLSESA